MLYSIVNSCFVGMIAFLTNIITHLTQELTLERRKRELAEADAAMLEGQIRTAKAFKPATTTATHKATTSQTLDGPLMQQIQTMISSGISSVFPGATTSQINNMSSSQSPQVQVARKAVAIPL